MIPVEVNSNLAQLKRGKGRLILISSLASVSLLIAAFFLNNKILNKPIQVVALCDTAVTSVYSLNDRGILAASAQDKTVTVWSVALGRLLVTPAFPTEITSICLSPSGKVMLVGCVNGEIYICDVSTGSLIRKWKGIQKPLQCVFSPTEDIVAIEGIALPQNGAVLSAQPRILTIWNVKNKQIINKGAKNFRLGRIKTMAFSQDGKSLLIGNRVEGQDRITILSLKNFIVKRVFTMQGYVNEIKVVNNASLLAATSNIETVDIHKGTVTRVKVLSNDAKVDYFSASAFCLEKNVLAATSFDSQVRLWDVSTGDFLGNVTLPQSDIQNISFFNKGHLMTVVRGAKLYLYKTSDLLG